ncbi:fluoride efflux transporter CrcB [Asticcacaulis sp. EMRT-3]|uniref:fluoride efflux transporter CrcB n=1 Tax=Asticcacaulis sp. EMRT-3 TaxID=3040349 RepID=UPI0024AFB12F|nr:fluoride efflux transporter CrcB [Asticcacaulis sp. EMRT-3]MDI7776381.1 fluoride efflux transporter CrcB [Asticcacaulis sp. EMRT-3]
MLAYLWVALGGAAGAMLRYWLSGVAATAWGETFPWGTLIINVTGSIFISFFATLTGPDGRAIVSSDVRTFVMIGVCGGYTTFSSFSLQTLNLARNGEFAAAGLNSLLSFALCLIGAWLGYLAAAFINQIESVRL